MKYFMLTGLGDMKSLGECKDFDDADEKATAAGFDANWIGDEETLERWEKQIAEVREEWK